MGWGNDSFTEVFAWQALRPEFDFQNPCNKKEMQCCTHTVLTLGNQRQPVPWDSLARRQSSRNEFSLPRNNLKWLMVLVLTTCGDYMCLNDTFIFCSCCSYKLISFNTLQLLIIFNKAETAEKMLLIIVKMVQQHQHICTLSLYKCFQDQVFVFTNNYFNSQNILESGNIKNQIHISFSSVI